MVVALSFPGLLLGLLPAASAVAGQDTTPPGAFDIVPDAGEFQTGWQVASPYSNVYVTWQTTTDESSAVRYELRVDGVLSRTVTDGGVGTLTKRIEVPDGRHTVTVAALDKAGNERLATHALDVVVDTVSPVFTTSPRLLLRRGPVTEAGYPMRFTWSGKDEGTGLALGRIGPDAACCYAFAPTLGQYDFPVRPRSSVAWRIWLYDGVGRVTRVGRDGFVAPVDWSQTRRSPGWSVVSDPEALGGSEWLSDRRGDRFAVSVKGRSVAWVASTGPRKGRAKVLLDGTVVANVDLYSPQRRPARVVWTAPVTRTATSRVSVVNRSTGHRTEVGVDALLLQR
jgi:Bacterial Ig-like domain